MGVKLVCRQAKFQSSVELQEILIDRISYLEKLNLHVPDCFHVTFEAWAENSIILQCRP